MHVNHLRISCYRDVLLWYPQLQIHHSVSIACFHVWRNDVLLYVTNTTLTLLSLLTMNSCRCDINVWIWSFAWNNNVLITWLLNTELFKNLHGIHCSHCTCSRIFRTSYCLIDTTITYRSETMQGHVNECSWVLLNICNSLSFSVCGFFFVFFLTIYFQKSISQFLTAAVISKD